MVVNQDTCQLRYKSWILSAPFVYKQFQYCCYVWAGAPSCYLEFLDKLQTDMQGCWSFTCYLS